MEISNEQAIYIEVHNDMVIVSTKSNLEGNYHYFERRDLISYTILSYTFNRSFSKSKFTYGIDFSNIEIEAHRLGYEFSFGQIGRACRNINESLKQNLKLEKSLFVKLTKSKCFINESLVCNSMDKRTQN